MLSLAKVNARSVTAIRNLVNAQESLSRASTFESKTQPLIQSSSPSDAHMGLQEAFSGMDLAKSFVSLCEKPAFNPIKIPEVKLSYTVDELREIGKKAVKKTVTLKHRIHQMKDRGIVEVLEGSFGFIRPNSGDSRIFFNRRSVANSQQLHRGDLVSYLVDIGKINGKMLAKDIARIPVVRDINKMWRR
eukprot:TRINITY_DN3172_c0_g1_i1.p2 TRINITY_DN3172_c0_g1~~TRINITY_DN3172_c0_g1_i1.p2  ORF type:complete len:189 (+),score=45.99 TRINITY_DN3172_c0_g1_i1:60-626(+)